MSSAVKVNLHCHSNLSDGELSPEAVAAALTRAGVRAAALTDHDTIEGLERFREALDGTSVRHVTGVELTAGDGGPVHLLAYGFDAASPALANAIARARQTRDGGALPVADAIELVHLAGGKVFLAHPLLHAGGIEELESRLVRYRQCGLDGIEAIYSQYSEEQVGELRRLARRLNLAVSAGCDFHGSYAFAPGLNDVSLLVDVEDWRSFRDLVLGSPPSRPRPEPPPPREAQRLNWRSFLLRILVPTALAIALLLGPLFVYLIPAFEEALLERKRETIRELAKSAASILEEYHGEAEAGRLSLADAQAAAIDRIQFMRYGKDGKDYFWITDHHPRMVVHPYRLDLNGQDLTDYRDPKGNRVFVDLVRVVQEGREGYHEYVWQWKDDARRMAPKQSYVRGFEPWGWIIGTGLYLEDVHGEIRAITGRVIRVTVVVALVIAVLLLFVALQSFRLERQRSRAEEALHGSHERYRVLVEASREGTALVLDGRFTCVNQTFLDLAGSSEEQLAFVDVEELIELRQGTIQELIERIGRGEPSPGEPLDATLLARGGGRLEVLLGIESVRLGDRHGVSLVVRDLRGQGEMKAALAESHARFRAVAENLRVGVFRASLEAHFPVIEANSAARRLFGVGEDDPLPHLEAVLGGDELAAFGKELLADGEVRDHILPLATGTGRHVSLTATLIADEAGRPRYCDAVVEDATTRQREAREQDELIADLQSPQLYLARPVQLSMQPAVVAPPATTIERAARMMTRLGSDALLVQGAAGEALGVITDRDLRERVVASGLGADRPVFEVMSAPVISVSAATPGHQALTVMQEHNVKHLAVRDAAGKVVGMVRTQDLLRTDHIPLALLSRHIREARRPEEVYDAAARLPALVQTLLDSGARSRYICRAISAVTDAVTARLVAFAVAQLGPPPTPSWAYLALGSQGREEQTLLADQDSAIVFEPPEGGEATDAQRYFLAVASRVAEWLVQAGFPACRGGVMASNPRWCLSLEQWRAQWRGWIGQAEPQQRLQAAAFLDFRCVAGDAALANRLRGFVQKELEETPSFLPLLARDVAQYRPPKALFGLASGSAPIDVKDAAAAVENVVRLYALNHGVSETSTFERLRRLEEVGAFTPTGHEELAQGYDFLMALRLRRQVERMRAGHPADNEIDPRSLNHLEEGLLKQVFSQLGTFQKKIGYDFLGGARL